MVTLPIIMLILTILYFYSTRTFKYWEERGIKHDKPVPFFGNNTKGFLLYKSVTQLAEDAYRKYPDEKVVGYFRGTSPELVVRDQDIVKRILITDFAHFYARGVNDHAQEPIMRNLFYADGDLWKLLRKRVNAVFTTSKLKAIFPMIVERAERLRTRAINIAADIYPIDIKNLIDKHTTDVIGACGFGLDAESLDEEVSELQKVHMKFFVVNFCVLLKAGLKYYFPKLFKNIVITSEFQQEYTAFVRKILNERNNETLVRGDFLESLLECQGKGKIVGDSLERVKEDGTPEEVSLEFDDSLIYAQLFVFYAAGLETTSLATSFTLHQLAYHPEVQIKTQEEIDKVLAKYNNKLCYEAIKEMKYLEMVFKEAMRILPSVGYLIRESAGRYTFPEIGLTIDKGVKVIIPVQAMHHDPEYYENPDKFRPERFSPDEYNHENKYVYLPFGEGPRACIGARFALMQSLTGLAAVLSSVTVEPSPLTTRKPIIDPRFQLAQGVKGGMPLMFLPRS